LADVEIESKRVRINCLFRLPCVPFSRLPKAYYLVDTFVDLRHFTLQAIGWSKGLECDAPVQHTCGTCRYGLIMAG
jgi:hypothetical protein